MKDRNKDFDIGNAHWPFVPLLYCCEDRCRLPSGEYGLLLPWMLMLPLSNLRDGVVDVVLCCVLLVTFHEFAGWRSRFTFLLGRHIWDCINVLEASKYSTLHFTIYTVYLILVRDTYVNWLCMSCACGALMKMYVWKNSMYWTEHVYANASEDGM